MPKYQSTQPGWRVLVIYEGRKSIVVVSAQQGQHVGEMKVAAAAAGCSWAASRCPDICPPRPQTSVSWLQFYRVIV